MCLESIHCRISSVHQMVGTFCLLHEPKKTHLPCKYINFLQLYNNNKGKCKTITIYQVAKRGKNGFQGNGDDKK